MSFLFAGALFALPLAGLPVLLHMLFQRKSPLLPFSTVRFIKASIQRNAARKRVQQWLLLAVRALLLALLIWAVAQPAKILASGWGQAGKSLIAAVVVDTSYSMELQEEQVSLLSRADGIVQDLLREQLKDARVAIFRSKRAPADQPEQLLTPSQILSEWTPLRAEPAAQPLVDRMAAAQELLKRQAGDEKWLVVISDFQKKEFPHPANDFPEGRLVMLDLHPAEARSAGITQVAIDPPQPTPGIGSDAVVDVIGHSGKARPVVLSIATPDGRKLAEGMTQMANLDSSGRARLRFPIHLPSERWMLLQASFQDQDDMAWDNNRARLVELPPRQIVDVLDAPSLNDARRFLKLALDPSEGKAPSWPLMVRPVPDVAPDANVAVLMLGAWPDEVHALRLLNFARAGGTMILFTRPGLEESWPQLAQGVKSALRPLLPSEPVIDSGIPDANIAGAPATADPLLAGLSDKRFQIESISVRRLVPFIPNEPQVSTLLSVFAKNPGPGARPHGLLFRRPVGSGTAYTFSTVPESEFTNLATHPIFLPMLVRMALRPPARTDGQNIELGGKLTLAGTQYAGMSELRIQGPRNDVVAIKPTTDGGIPRFEFDHADAPGVYNWRKTGSDEVVAMTNVHLPANESDLFYSPAETLMDPAENIVVAHSVEELQGRFHALSEPEPRWTGPIAVVLLLLCAEAFMGSAAKVWKPPTLGAFIPKLRT